MFKIIWDKENNGVLLTMESNEDAIKVPPRPVFYEELDLLGMNKYWKYPKSKEPLLWACNRRYFNCGELVLQVKGGNIYDDPTLDIKPNAIDIILKPIDLELLVKKNESAMFLVEHEAMSFINDIFRKYSSNGYDENLKIDNEIDFYKLAEKQEKITKKKHAVVKEDCNSFDIMPLSQAEAQGKKVIPNTSIEMFIASFSAGKDSQVLLDLVSRVIPSNEYSVIYSDTGYEIPSSLDLWETTKKFYQSKYPDLKFFLSKNHQDVMYYWDKMGPPSNIHRWCCSVMKTAPLYRFLKNINGTGRQPNILTFDGVRAEESLRRANYNRVGKNVKHNNVINTSPILNWNLAEIYLYIFSHNLPLNIAYRKGLTRVGCITCPFSSDWNDRMCNKLYPEKLKPFINKIEGVVKRAGVKDIDNYIKQGNWKIRAGGRNIESFSSVNIISNSPHFKAVLNNPQENFFTWLKVLGEFNYTEKPDKIIGNIKYKNKIFEFEIIKNNQKNALVIEVKNTDNEILFLSHLKKILNKTTFCVHCEACEVECPTGALSVVPMVSIDESKCIHCLKCLDFDDKGCIVANSINTSNFSNMRSKKTSINRYNNFGLRENWLSGFFNNTSSYFDNDEHGLNVLNQIPSLINWLREAEILDLSTKNPTETGELLAQEYINKSTVIWEIIWINLSYNSEICKWYSSNLPFHREYLKSEIEIILQDSYPEYRKTTLTNALGALLNTYKESPLGNAIGVGKLSRRGRKPVVTRLAYNSISPVAVAYSLYRYAESHKRYNLTVSELFNDNQKEGVYSQFGIYRESLETILRTIKEEKNRVLNVDLNMGLDNISLREDLTSIDILKILL